MPKGKKLPRASTLTTPREAITITTWSRVSAILQPPQRRSTLMTRLAKLSRSLITPMT
jgi:hypothetical protein